MSIDHIKEIVKSTHHASVAGISARAALNARLQADVLMKQSDKLLKAAKQAKADAPILEAARKKPRMTERINIDPNQPIEPPLIPDLVGPPPNAPRDPSPPADDGDDRMASDSDPDRPDGPPGMRAARPRRRNRRPTTRQVYAASMRMQAQEARQARAAAHELRARRVAQARTADAAAARRPRPKRVAYRC